ncbi:MAG TPA: alpha/beta hydrolase [Candidatus Hydrogenedentes bacterium]|nr:alpha/beta hydrolase [Candidatus Hydrogenedentota bacterium]HOL77330.1 alpha/beta hydrolase [Candidatus Hydrogenedentota bacterium]HPO85972.1 alpha/beta hydrolase [Candidatus Hydrogenedentota bacterium]
MSKRNRITLAVVIVFLCIVAAGEGTKLWYDRHFYDGYSPELALNASVTNESTRTDYRRIELSFEGVPGMRVPTILTLPLEGTGPFPCIIFLHGIGQDKRFLDEIAAPFCQAGFAMATFDQYMRGDRKLKDPSALESVLAFRRRASLTVIETRRLVDYLQTREDIASKRIYLVGASYGAITGSTAAAFEPRIRAVVLIYGGGDFRYLFNSRAGTSQLGKWFGVAHYFTSWLLAPADPVNYIAEIAPRPILFQNGTNDSLIPREAAQALYDAAREPKSITWYEGDHIGTDVETVHRVLDEALNWLKAQDAAVQP